MPGVAAHVTTSGRVVAVSWQGHWVTEGSSAVLVGGALPADAMQGASGCLASWFEAPRSCPVLFSVPWSFGGSPEGGQDREESSLRTKVEKAESVQMWLPRPLLQRVNKAELKAIKKHLAASW